MRNEEAKGVDEVRFFSRFVELSGCQYNLCTVKKRPTPEPDILCVHQTDGPVAFELAELCDSKMAKSYADPENAPALLRSSDPTARIVVKKLGRKYVTKWPIELLFYTNGAIITPVDIILRTIRTYLRPRHPYRKIWLLSNKEVYPVWPQLKA